MTPMQLRLETPRLILRSFEDQDLLPFFQYRSDPEVALYQGWPWPYTREMAADFVNEMKSHRPGIPGDWFQLAVILKAKGEMIGDCGFHRLFEDPRQTEIGFTLAKLYQRQGYGYEMTRRLLDYLFNGLGLHRVRANCDPQNKSSVKLLEKLGMRHEGRFIQSLWYKGAWADEDWYAILEQEWQGQKHLKKSPSTGAVEGC